MSLGTAFIKHSLLLSVLRTWVTRTSKHKHHLSKIFVIAIQIPRVLKVISYMTKFHISNEIRHAVGLHIKTGGNFGYNGEAYAGQFMSTWHKVEGNSTEKTAPSYWPVNKTSDHFDVVVCNWCGNTLGSVPDRSKPSYSFSPYPLLHFPPPSSCLGFLPWLSPLMVCDHRVVKWEINK